jgi:hypothetical protein
MVTSVIKKKTAQSNLTHNGRKFVQSGHPVDNMSPVRKSQCGQRCLAITPEFRNISHRKKLPKIDIVTVLRFLRKPSCTYVERHIVENQETGKLSKVHTYCRKP